jgi:hypothetical protein
MASSKAILSAISLGLGAALVFMVTTIQRDRFAFTAHEARNSDALAAPSIEPVEPSYVIEPASATEPITTIRFQALEVKPALRPLQKTQPSRAGEPVKTTAPPCRPAWRELESGPAGRLVREVCPAVMDVPRS